MLGKVLPGGAEDKSVPGEALILYPKDSNFRRSLADRNGAKQESPCSQTGAFWSLLVANHPPGHIIVGSFCLCCKCNCWGSIFGARQRYSDDDGLGHPPVSFRSRSHRNSATSSTSTTCPALHVHADKKWWSQHEASDPGGWSSSLAMKHLTDPPWSRS